LFFLFLSETASQQELSDAIPLDPLS